MNNRFVVIDNGAGRIKYGPAGEDSSTSVSLPASTAAHSSSSSSSSSPLSSSMRGANSIPNCVARMNKQMQVLVGDQVDGVANGSLLSFTRPFEKGYMTNIHCQIEVWSRLFNKILKINKPDDTCLVVTEAPFVPETLQDEMNEVIFEDFGFNACLRRPAAWFSAYEYAQSNPLNIAKNSCQSCVVVDSGFSFR